MPDFQIAPEVQKKAAVEKRDLFIDAIYIIAPAEASIR